MRCAVTGATGYVGGRLVPQLLDRGHDVRAVARRPSKLANVPWREDAEVVRGDLGDADSLLAAFDGADVVYYLVHSMGTSRNFAAEEERAADNVATAARRAGVRRLVYLSGLHPSDAKLSPHLQSRTRVGEILLASGIETLVLQAGVIIGSGSASFEMIRHLTDRLPVMTTPKWVHNRIQPIAVRDVLHYLVEAATVDVPESRTWDIGGPDVLEYGEMMQIYADVAGLHRRAIVVLPLLTPTIASWWVGLVTPIPSGLARPLVESLHCDAVMGNHDIDAVIPPPPGGLTGYRDSVSLALKRIADGTVETSWSDAAREAPSEPLPSDPDWAGAVALYPQALRVDGGHRGRTLEADRKHSRTTGLAGESPRAGSPHATPQERQSTRRRVVADARRHRVRSRKHLSPTNDFLPQGNSWPHLLVRRIAPAPQAISGGVPRRAGPGCMIQPNPDRRAARFPSARSGTST